MGILGPDGQPMDGDQNDAPQENEEITPKNLGLDGLSDQELRDAMRRVDAFISSPDGQAFGAAIVAAHQVFAWARCCLEERNISGPIAKLFIQATMSMLFNPDGTAKPFHGEQLYKTLLNIVIPSLVAETTRRQRIAAAGAGTPDTFNDPDFRFPMPFDELNAELEGGLKRGTTLILRGEEEPVKYGFDTIMRNFSASQHRLTLLTCDPAANALRHQVWVRSNVEIFAWDWWRDLMSRSGEWDKLKERMDGTDILLIERIEDLSESLPVEDVYRKVVGWCRSKSPPVALIVGTRTSDLVARVRFAHEVSAKFHAQSLDQHVGLKSLIVGNDVVLAYPEMKVPEPGDVPNDGERTGTPAESAGGDREDPGPDDPPGGGPGEDGGDQPDPGRQPEEG